MSREDGLRFDADTDVEFAEPVTIKDVHLKDLSFVLETTTSEDGHVDDCVIDLRDLLDAVTVYSAQDQFRYGWRRRRHDERAADE